MKQHRRNPPSQLASHRQSGVVLIVAMVMLVVIGLASVAIMRNALNTDLVSDNSRRQNQALQYAQAGLRYCESLVIATTLTPQAEAATLADEAWQKIDNWQDAKSWSDTGSKRVVNSDFLTNASKDNLPPTPPQCMAQKRKVGTVDVVVVTSRGFSDNYAEDSSNRTTAGSVVWLQSIIQLAAKDS
jgi:type IV pilus assembly protein PilX